MVAEILRCLSTRWWRIITPPSKVGILGRFSAGELEAELMEDPRTGRWKVPRRSLNGLGAELLSEAELTWQNEKPTCLPSCAGNELGLTRRASESTESRKGLLGSGSERKGCAEDLGS